MPSARAADLVLAGLRGLLAWLETGVFRQCFHLLAGEERLLAGLCSYIQAEYGQYPIYAVIVTAERATLPFGVVGGRDLFHAVI